MAYFLCPKSYDWTQNWDLKALSRVNPDSGVYVFPKISMLYNYAGNRKLSKFIHFMLLF